MLQDIKEDLPDTMNDIIEKVKNTITFIKDNL